MLILQIRESTENRWYGSNWIRSHSTNEKTYGQHLHNANFVKKWKKNNITPNSGINPLPTRFSINKPGPTCELNLLDMRFEVNVEKYHEFLNCEEIHHQTRRINHNCQTHVTFTQWQFGLFALKTTSTQWCLDISGGTPSRHHETGRNWCCCHDFYWTYA